MLRLHKNKTKLMIKMTLILVILLCITSYNKAFAYEEEVLLVNSTKAYFCSPITKGYGNGDCILLENYDSFGNKVFGLIDAGRDIAKPDVNGVNSSVVVEFLKSHGVKKLDFMAITHLHIDHMGDAVSVLKNFKVDKIYMKEFDASYVTDGTPQSNFENIIKLAIDKDIKVIGTSYLAVTSREVSPSLTDDFIANYVPRAKEENFERFFYNSEVNNNIVFKFGSSEIRIYNWEMYDEDGNQYYTGITTDKSREVVDNENNNSIGLLLTQGMKRAFFAGDINNSDKNDETGRVGDEDRIKDYIGDVDFLKLGHHGYINSNTMDYMNVLNPENAVITNDSGKVYEKTMNYLQEKDVKFAYSTSDDNEIVVTISSKGIFFGNDIPESIIIRKVKLDLDEEILSGSTIINEGLNIPDIIEDILDEEPLGTGEVVNTTGNIPGNDNVGSTSGSSSGNNVDNTTGNSNQQVNNSGNNNSSNGNTNANNTNNNTQQAEPVQGVSTDKTVATGVLPRTGKSRLILMVLGADLILVGFFLIKNRKYKGIEDK